MVVIIFVVKTEVKAKKLSTVVSYNKVSSGGCYTVAISTVAYDGKTHKSIEITLN